jgi:hypothetical protein
MYFGSEKWIIHQLEKILISAREQAWAAYEEIIAQNDFAVDYDSYAYVCIPKKSRKFWKMLDAIHKAHDWLDISYIEGCVYIKPLKEVNSPIEKAAEAKACTILAEALQAEGIEAECKMSYR